MTQKDAMRKVVEFMNRQMRGYGLKSDQITGKTFAVVKTTNGLDTIATVSSYYKPTDLLIWIDGFIGRGVVDSLAHA
jgi:hypothetical protein